MSNVTKFEMLRILQTFQIEKTTSFQNFIFTLGFLFVPKNLGVGKEDGLVKLLKNIFTLTIFKIFIRNFEVRAELTYCIR